jgi:polysaccharide biosynthesis/export protein
MRSHFRALLTAVLLSCSLCIAQSDSRSAPQDSTEPCLQTPKAPCLKSSTSVNTNQIESRPERDSNSRPPDAGSQAEYGLQREAGEPGPSANRQGKAVPITPPEEPSEFQHFVQSSAGKILPVFGYDLFGKVPTTFAPLDRVAVPANYVVGPGDELLVRIWGQIGVDARLIVDRDGQIYLPKVGSLSVAGVHYDQLATHLKNAIGRDFRNFELTVTLGQLRSVQVFVVGYAQRPGSYTVSSLSTLVNALFVSGGPSKHGSMRHIQLRRGDQVVTDFDMYELLLKGRKSNDATLLPGDVIYIPPVGPQVAMAGSVNFPAIYELRDKTLLAEEIEIAGGLTNVADGQRVIVERVENRTTRKVEEFRLDENGNGRELHDGDLVRVFSVSPRFQNAVTLRGNVSEPGRYPYRPGMTIRDLIPNREFLLTREFWKRQNQVGNTGTFFGKDESRNTGNTRKNSEPGNVGISSEDTEQRSSERTSGSIESRNSEAKIDKNEVRNDVKRNAPEINWDYAVVQRLNPVDLSTTLLPFNLGKAILENVASENLALQPGDVVTIFSQRDISMSIKRQSRFVTLEGEVHAPGMYRVNEGETLYSVIRRAGGLTDAAYVMGSTFTRESARVQQQESLDQLIRELDLQVLQNQASYSRDKDESVVAQADAKRGMIQKLRELKATGRVVLKTQSDRTDETAFVDMGLEDGDVLMIPHVPSTVSVVGAVYNQNSFVFQEHTVVNDYLKLAGSGRRDADMKHIFVIRANGSVLSKRNTAGGWSGGLENRRVLPGDTVVVPMQLDKGNVMRGLKDISQLVAQFGLGIAAISVFK